MPPWWNWQTRRTQNPVVVIPCRFDSDRRHQKRTQVIYCVLFLLSVFRKFFLILSASSTTLVAEYSLSLVAFALFVRSAKWLRTRTQNPVVAIPCRFDSDRRHQKKNASYLLRSFSFVRFPQILFDFICLFHHPRGGILAFARGVRSLRSLG